MDCAPQAPSAGRTHGSALEIAAHESVQCGAEQKLLVSMILGLAFELCLRSSPLVDGIGQVIISCNLLRALILQTGHL